MPQVSIFMPTFNCAKYVAGAIQSLIDQTYDDWELFVCDDGSTDGTPTVLKSFVGVDPRIDISFNNMNIGKVATLTSLYKRATGKYVVFHDSDDVSHRERLRLQVNVFLEDPGVGLVGSGYTMVDSRGTILNTVLPDEEHLQIVESIKTGSPFHFPTVMFKKQYLDNERILFRTFFGDNNEDVDLSYRVLTQSKGRNIGRVLYVYRILENSISRKIILRNALFFYCVARDLAQVRMLGKNDWLDDPVERAVNLAKYSKLTDKHDILIYANSVSYFLSYAMHKKAIAASFLSFAQVPLVKAIKLVMVTFFKVMISVSTRKRRGVLDLHAFSKGSLG